MGQVRADGCAVALPNIHGRVSLPEPVCEGIIEQVSSADEERFNQEKTTLPCVNYHAGMGKTCPAGMHSGTARNPALERR